MAGIFRVAWKILRGAVVASTAIVTVGVAAKADADRIAAQTAPRILERFIVRETPCLDDFEPVATESKTIAVGEGERTEPALRIGF